MKNLHLPPTFWLAFLLLSHCLALQSVWAVKSNDSDLARNLRLVKSYHPTSPGQHEKQNPGETLDLELLLKISKEQLGLSNTIALIGRTRDATAIPTLVEKLDFKNYFVESDGIPPWEETYPAVGALKQIGKPAIPFLIEAAAEEKHSKQLRSNAIYTLSVIIDDRDNESTRFLLKKYRLEYDQQARRQTYLLKELAKLEVPKTPKTLPVAMPLTEPEIEADLIKALELRDTLIGTATPAPDENQVVVAIQKVATLQTEMLIPILIDKLDFEPPVASQEDKNIFPMYAEPQGLLSPTITEASIKAILQIGPKALPTLIDAIAMRGRGSRFRANALPLIVQLAGGKTQAEKLLVQAAEDDTKKAERLREMAASLPKVR